MKLIEADQGMIRDYCPYGSDDDFECPRHEAKLCARKVGMGHVQYVFQCPKCGEAISKALKHASIPKNTDISPWDGRQHGRFKEERLRFYDNRRVTKNERYLAYLETDEWKAKRQKILARCHGICEGCGERKVTEVHHLTYAHVGDELLFELVGLCDDCHIRVHNDWNLWSDLSS